MQQGVMTQQRVKASRLRVGDRLPMLPDTGLWLVSAVRASWRGVIVTVTRPATGEQASVRVARSVKVLTERVS